MGFLNRIRKKGAPATPADADQLVIRQLESRGADLTKPRHVIHYLYFPGEAEARRAAMAIEQAGYDAAVGSPNDGIQEWSVRAEGHRVVETSTVEGFRAWFERIAGEHRGEYDGWEAAAKP